MGVILDRRLWIGLAAAIVTVIAGFALTALLIGREWLAESRVLPAVCMTYALAALLGGGIVVVGRDRRLPRAMLLCGILYVTVCIVALSSGQAIHFIPDGLWITAAILCGGIASALVMPAKGKRAKRHNRTVNRVTPRKRPVT